MLVEKESSKGFSDIPIVGIGAFDMLTILVSERYPLGAIDCVSSAIFPIIESSVMATVLAASPFFWHDAPPGACFVKSEVYGQIYGKHHTTAFSR
ncbi:MAG: hypothetical protein IH899_22435 [Planctomycetes bacterium]|nr:hypothetical protein [Planctomycetota bacterium]